MSNELLDKLLRSKNYRDMCPSGHRAAGLGGMRKAL